jgi:hypothetical protein
MGKKTIDFRDVIGFHMKLFRCFMLLDESLQCLLCLLDKNIINNHIIFSNLYSKLNAVPMKLLVDFYIVIQEELVASDQFGSIFV